MSELPTQPKLDRVSPQPQQISYPRGGPNQPGQYGYGFPPPAGNPFNPQQGALPVGTPSQQGGQFTPVNAPINQQNQGSVFCLKIVIWGIAGVLIIWGLINFGAGCKNSKAGFYGEIFLTATDPAHLALYFGLLPLICNIVLIFGALKNSKGLCCFWLAGTMYFFVLTVHYAYGQKELEYYYGTYSYKYGQAFIALLTFFGIIIVIIFTFGMENDVKPQPSVAGRGWSYPGASQQQGQFPAPQPQPSAAAGGWNSGANQQQGQFPARTY